MPRTLKRGVDAISRDVTASASSSPAPSRRHRQRSSSESSVSSADEDAGQSQADTQHKTLVKKLVRLALATEYSRSPLRRADISSKIFKDANAARKFKTVFTEAQKVLESTFGMKLVELPSKEKTTLKDRRTQTTQTKAASSSSKSWILVSVLPDEYKNNPAIIQPTHAPTVEREAAYTAMYSFILALIYLNNGDLPEQKLERYMKRVNADTYTDFGSLEKLLQRLNREGYIEKRRETSSGEEVVNWVVGPRGKVEVGVRGVAGLVRSVYGFGTASAEGEVQKTEEDDLNDKLSRILGVTIGEKRPVQDVEMVDGEGQEPAPEEVAPRQRKSRRRHVNDDDDNDE